MAGPRIQAVAGPVARASRQRGIGITMAVQQAPQRAGTGAAGEQAQQRQWSSGGCAMDAGICAASAAKDDGALGRRRFLVSGNYPISTVRRGA